MSQRHGNQRLHLSTVRYVCWHRKRFPALGADQIDSLQQFKLPSSGDHDFCTITDKRQRRCPTNSTSAPRNQRDTILQT